MGNVDQVRSKRERLEEELQERRTRLRPVRKPPVVHVADAPATRPGLVLELVCGACEAVNASDALFCKLCGTKFNVRLRLSGSLVSSGSK
jgi:ribosomal protein L40E